MLYNLGDIVLVEDYDVVSNAWIAVDGTMYYVTTCDHDDLAHKWGSSVDDCERKGYIHLSYSQFVNFETPKPTKQQVDTIMLWCSACNVPVPAWAIPLPERYTNPTSISNRYLYNMTRKQRDIFYPNSGD